MADANEVREVQALLARRLGDLRITDIKIEEDTDADGDSVLRVVVVYDAANKFNASKLSGLLRSLRPALGEHGEARFPVMSFVSRKDFEGYAGAA